MSSTSHTVYSAEAQSTPTQRKKAATLPTTSHKRVVSDSRSLRPINSRLSTRPTLSNLRRALTLQMEPSKPLGKPPGFWKGLQAVVTASWLNILLIFIPVSWALHFAPLKGVSESTHDTIVFVFAFLAIIPLAKLLAFATDELSMRVGQTLAGLMNATLGNAVELIVAIIALVKCELQVVQSSLVGSILSNLLLVLGMCFFAGGTRFSEQGFGVSAVQLNSSLLTVAVIAVLLPAAFHFVAGSVIADDTEGKEILSLSHGAAIILLWIYGSYLVFQLFSHTSLYAEGDDNEDIIKSKRYAVKPKKEGSPTTETSSQKFLNKLGFSHAQNKPEDVPLTDASVCASPKLIGSPEMVSPSGSASNLNLNRDVEAQDDTESKAEEEGEEQPQMSVLLTLVVLVVVTVLVAVTAEFLVDSINGMVAAGGISKEFVGMILLPIVGNAAEHVTAVTVSVKDKLTLSLGVAVGSSIQIALFVIPFIVTLGWIIDKPLTLLFDPFESIVLFLSVMVVNYTVQDGKSNWLEGMILMCLYIILAVVFWYYPGLPIVLGTQCSG
ncbi:Sodium/calcium exchanger protein-domain-containing protein [Abortiporus biennis]|nr:Sodium/calcium exchanger protein-domain-containing protein [Abortiporus biennis]